MQAVVINPLTNSTILEKQGKSEQGHTLPLNNVNYHCYLSCLSCAKCCFKHDQPARMETCIITRRSDLKDCHVRTANNFLSGIPGAELLQRLSSYDYQRQYRNRARRRLEHTTEWILKEPAFVTWLGDGKPQCLWLTGISKAFQLR
jgi:hypothetical protein